MKKAFKIVVILLVLIVVVIVAIPFVFKSQLEEKAREEISNSVNADVSFGDFDLSLISSFPNLSFEINDIQINGETRFDSIQLLSVSKMFFDLDLMSVIKGDQIKINEVSIDGINLNALVLEDGVANYDIMKEGEPTSGESSESSKYKISLKKYNITNSNIVYDNRSLKMYLNIKGLDHQGNGDFSDESFSLNTLTNAASIDMVYEGMAYIAKAEAEIKADIDISDKFTHYILKDNEVRLNKLLLKAEGTVDMPKDGIEFDIKYHTLKTDLKNILSLIPKDFMSDLDGLKTNGTMGLNGSVFGKYDDKNLPAFSANFIIENGMIQYPDLPKSIDDIQTNAKISFPGGVDFDALTVDVKSFNMLIAESPIHGKLHLKNPMTDPYIDMAIDAQVDLSTIKDAVELESIEDLSGIITANVDLKGRVSSIEKEEYEQFDARGKVILQDMIMKSDPKDPEAMPDLNISIASLDFSPQYLKLNNFESTMGKSDFQMKGEINNYLSYYLKDELLKGNFNLVSSQIDLNELMSADDTTAQSVVDGTEEQMEMLEVPANIDVTFNASIKKLIYDNMELGNVNGEIKVVAAEASMSNVTMNVLGGEVLLNGLYSTASGTPSLDFDYKVKRMQIKPTAETFNTVEKLAPITAKCTGKYSSVFNMKMDLDKNMNPLYNTISGAGDMSTFGVVIDGFKPLTKIADVLKIPGLDKKSINDVKLKFEITEGKVVVKPFDVNIDGIPSNIRGTTSLAGEMDYIIAMKIPIEKLGNNVNSTLANIVGSVQVVGMDFKLGNTVNMNIAMTGTVDNPKIKPMLMGSEGQTLKETVVETVKEELNAAKDKAIDDAKIKAREEAAKIIAEAEKQAQRIKDEVAIAADKVRAEAKKAGDRLIKESNNPIAKLAAKKAAEKLNKTADKKAKKMQNEANVRADKIVADAKKRAADKLK